MVNDIFFLSSSSTRQLPRQLPRSSFGRGLLSNNTERGGGIAGTKGKTWFLVDLRAFGRHCTHILHPASLHLFGGALSYIPLHDAHSYCLWSGKHVRRHKRKRTRTRSRMRVKTRTRKRTSTRIKTKRWKPRLGSQEHTHSYSDNIVTLVRDRCVLPCENLTVPPNCPSSTKNTPGQRAAG